MMNIDPELLRLTLGDLILANMINTTENKKLKARIDELEKKAAEAAVPPG